MSDDEQRIEAENRSGLWREAAGHLLAAVHSIEQAAGTLSDVNIDGTALALVLDVPLREVRESATLCDRRAGEALREATT